MSYRSHIAKVLKHPNISSLVSNLVFSVSGFLAFIILSRTVDPGRFGSWILYLSVASFMDMVIVGLTRNAVVFYGSGKPVELTHQKNAAAMMAMIYISIVVAILFWALCFTAGTWLTIEWRQILFWYPLLAFSSLSRVSALSFLQARTRYHNTIAIRLVQTLLFLAACIVLVYLEQVSFVSLVVAHIGSSLISSLYGMIKGWDSLLYLRRVTWPQIIEIVDYGRYTLATTLGSSLLKSADVFIIGLSAAMGSASIAIYAIPMKMVEIFEIPIRSYAITAFNRLTVYFRDNNAEQLRLTFWKYSILTLLLILPLVLFILLLPEWILTLFGSTQYVEHIPVMVMILYITTLYCVLLVLDRMIGVLLESLGLPQKNTSKTMLMTLANVIGDLVAIFYFQSLVGVAIASVVFTLIGIFYGWRMVPIKLSLSHREVIPLIKVIFKASMGLIKREK